MRTTRPPIIAAWILHRFGPSPETDVIAGDLLEEYQQGRSRLWYWREVIVAILTGTWSEVKRHSLSLLGAIAMGWILGLAWHSVITPFEYALIDRYVFGSPRNSWQFAFVLFLAEAPLAVAIGWTTARFARRCRISAVFGMAGSVMVIGAWWVLDIALSAWSADRFYFSVWWPFLLSILLLTGLILFGGGLLTGSPKRSIARNDG